MIENKLKEFDLPLKIIFTEEGVNYFIRTAKQLKKFRMADNLEAYGILLNQFSPVSIQQMMSIDYISKIEISRSEFMSKKHEILDLSKLIVFGILYMKFDSEVFDLLIHSDLIRQWNRMNPGRIIDERTKTNDKFMKAVLEKRKDVIDSIKQEILYPFYFEVENDNTLLPDEKNTILLMSERYLEKMRSLIWFILSRYKDTETYQNIIEQIRGILRRYQGKSKIAEYLSLMSLELLGNAENSNLQHHIKRVYRSKINSERLIFDKNLRFQMFQELDRIDEKLYLSWKIKGNGKSIGTGHRLQVTIYNKESEYEKLRESINDKKSIDLKEKSLKEFYQEIPASVANTELGLYYLSYLSDACANVGVRFESNVHQISATGLTVITLKLNF